MTIDLTSLMLGDVDELFIEGEVFITSDHFVNTSVRKLENTYFKGSISGLSDGKFQIIGEVYGNMILPDDVTLEDVVCPYRVEIDDNLTLEGDGWRLITEEELKASNNSPFNELSKIFDSGKE